jgi:hypothetical protein
LPTCPPLTPACTTADARRPASPPLAARSPACAPSAPCPHVYLARPHACLAGPHTSAWPQDHARKRLAARAHLLA